MDYGTVFERPPQHAPPRILKVSVRAQEGLVQARLQRTVHVATVRIASDVACCHGRPILCDHFRVPHPATHSSS